MEIWALIKTIPVLARIFEMIFQSYQAHQISLIVNKAEAQKEEVNLMMEKLKNAKSNDERRLLLRIISKL